MFSNEPTFPVFIPGMGVMGIPQFHLPHSDSTPHGSPGPWTPLGRFHLTPGGGRAQKKDQVNIADQLPARFTSIFTRVSSQFLIGWNGKRFYESKKSAYPSEASGGGGCFVV